MRILEQKGVLTHTKSGRTYIFRPLLTREQAIQNQIRYLVDRFFNGNPMGLIEVLISDGIKSKEQYRTIADKLESLRTR